MARRVFFSFHYQRDAQRAQVVRNSYLTRQGGEAEAWVNAAAWEDVKRGGDAAIRAWINARLDRASVVVVLIGAETARRRYVQYEIRRAHALGRGLIGVNVNAIRDFLGNIHLKGPNPFALFTDAATGTSLATLYPVYGWVADDGYNNFGRWVERAAVRAGF